MAYFKTGCLFRTCPYSGYTLRSPIEAPLITREVLPETYYLLVIMAADARARPFLQFQASCSADHVAASQTNKFHFGV
jgi:hypothetical protein